LGDRPRTLRERPRMFFGVGKGIGCSGGPPTLGGGGPLGGAEQFYNGGGMAGGGGGRILKTGFGGGLTGNLALMGNPRRFWGKKGPANFFALWMGGGGTPRGGPLFAQFPPIQCWGGGGQFGIPPPGARLGPVPGGPGPAPQGLGLHFIRITGRRQLGRFCLLGGNEHGGFGGGQRVGGGGFVGGGGERGGGTTCLFFLGLKKRGFFPTWVLFALGLPFCPIPTLWNKNKRRGGGKRAKGEQTPKAWPFTGIFLFLGGGGWPLGPFSPFAFGPHFSGGDVKKDLIRTGPQGVVGGWGLCRLPHRFNPNQKKTRGPFRGWGG